MNRFASTKIAECCDILDSKRIPLNDEERFIIKGDIPYYGANGVQGHISKYIFDEPLILLAEDGGNFGDYMNRPIAYRIYGKSWVNNHAHILKAKHGYNQDYIFYSLVHKNILKHIAGGTRSKLTRSELNKIEISLPGKDIQQKIAKILNSTDKAIAQTDATIAKLQKIKTGLMQDLFTRGIDSNGKLRPTYEEKPELYKSSPLGMIPKDWSCAELSNLAIVNDGTHFTPNYLEHGVPFLRVTDIVNVKNGFTDLKFISREEHSLLIKRCKPEKGDILYSKNGTIGIPKLIDWDFEFSIFVSLALIKIISTDITSTFLELQLDTFLIWNQIKKRAKQGTVTNLHLEEIREFQIVIPPPLEQEAIVSKIKFFKDMLEREEKGLAKFNAIKSGLMQDLLTGKVEVKVDKDE